MPGKRSRPKSSSCNPKKKRCTYKCSSKKNLSTKAQNLMNQLNKFNYKK